MYSVVNFFLFFFGGWGYYGSIRHLGITDNTSVGFEQIFKVINAGKQHKVKSLTLVDSFIINKYTCIYM